MSAARPGRAAGSVTVAIPTLNGGALLAETLAAVRAQELDRPIDLLVIDSGSRDGSVAAARDHGARVIEIPPQDFSHGGVRQLAMERSDASHVAFLTQDATPADPDWLARLLAAFDLADDVALAYGPYRARPDASLMVRRELDDYFRSMAPDGRPRLIRVEPGSDPGWLRAPGPEAFFTDANGAVARWAWERVPFRQAPYAEDRLLAIDMLRAGFAKVFVPDAAVVHSHDYRPLDQLRRTFDEWRGLREVLGWVQPAGPRTVARAVRDGVRGDLAAAGAQRSAGARIALAARSARYHALRAAGAALGSRADRLPPRVRRACSLERRASFEPAASLSGPSLPSPAG
jgi:GT2 family glycosyltransferase